MWHFCRICGKGILPNIYSSDEVNYEQNNNIVFLNLVDMFFSTISIDDLDVEIILISDIIFPRMKLQAMEYSTFDQPAQIRYERQMLTGSLIYLKFLNRASKQVSKSIGVILNENTVLTLASSILDRETDVIFIQSELAKDRGQQSQACDFVLLKLPTNASCTDTLCFKLNQEETQNYHKDKNQMSIIQERCRTLERQLQQALSNVNQLTQKIGEYHKLLIDVESILYSKAGEYCQNNVFKYQQAIDCYNHCKFIREKLHGVDSLETVQLSLDICHIYSRDLQDYDSATQLYSEVLSIYQRHGMQDDQAYSQVLFQLGYACCQMRNYKEGIRFLEQALHRFAGHNEAKEIECANFLSMMLRRSGQIMGYQCIKRKYGFRF